MAGIPTPNVCVSTPRVFGLHGRFEIANAMCSQYCNAFFFRVDIVDHTGPFGGAMCAQLIESNGLVFMWRINFLQPAMAN